MMSFLKSGGSSCVGTTASIVASLLIEVDLVSLSTGELGLELLADLELILEESKGWNHW